MITYNVYVNCKNKRTISMSLASSLVMNVVDDISVYFITKFS